MPKARREGSKVTASARRAVIPQKKIQKNITKLEQEIDRLKGEYKAKHSFWLDEQREEFMEMINDKENELKELKTNLEGAGVTAPKTASRKSIDAIFTQTPEDKEVMLELIASTPEVKKIMQTPEAQMAKMKELTDLQTRTMSRMRNIQTLLETAQDEEIGDLLDKLNESTELYQRLSTARNNLKTLISEMPKQSEVEGEQRKTKTYRQLKFSPYVENQKNDVEDQGVEETKEEDVNNLQETKETEDELPSTSTLKYPQGIAFAVDLGAARTRSRKPSRFGGLDSKKENASSETTSTSVNLDPISAAAAAMMSSPVPIATAPQQADANTQTSKTPDEKEDAVGQATTESTRQNELASNETATLDYKPNFTEVMDASNMRLATDASRGNLGSGTTAEMQSADLWGNQFTQPPPDIPVEPERFLTTSPDGMTVEESADTDKTDNVYSFLPFAKLSGDLVWVPRHVKAARFFFTSDDYQELVSHIRDGDPLTLDKTVEVDSVLMMSTIIKSYGTLKQFCELGSMLPMSASVEQVYAEWLEMRQIGKAVARYEQITGGMYENSELSMKGGIRAAVASALRPFIAAWNQMHTNVADQISMDASTTKPLSGPMYGGKRKAESGIIEPQEFNPQFSYQPVDLKRVKFSIPSI